VYALIKTNVNLIMMLIRNQNIKNVIAYDYFYYVLMNVLFLLKPAYFIYNFF